MTDGKLNSYPEHYDWVKVRSNHKLNLDRREWNNQTNVPIKEDEEVILPRGSSDPDKELSGMKFYFKNNFFEVIDPEPFGNEIENNAESAPEDDDETHQCPECDREFDSEQGMKAHKRQKHENKDEEGEN